MGDARNPHSISIKDESVIQKSMHGLVVPFPTPQSYELAISRMKRGGIEFMMAGYILLASPVWSVPPLWEHQCWLPHTLVPLHWTFHPWFNRDTPENTLRITQSFLFTQPREGLTICCWASGRQFTLHGTSSVSLLSGVCSSRAVRMQWTHLGCMTVQRGIPSAEAMRKRRFQWRTNEHPVCRFFTRYEGTPSETWVFHFIVPPLPSTSLSSSLSRHQL